MSALIKPLNQEAEMRSVTAQLLIDKRADVNQANNRWRNAFMDCSTKWSYRNSTIINR